MMTVDPQSRARTTWQTVVAILAAILLFAGGCAGDSAAEDEPASAETTTTTSPTTTPPTTTAPATTTTTEAVDPPADLTALQEMVDSYYEAYNSGDAATALAMFSPLSPEVPPNTLEFWIENLGEQVTAECVPSVDPPGGLYCVERYSDQMHGPAGETIRATFQYIDRDGRLSRAHDRFEMRPLECIHLDYRCPGDAVDIVGNDVFWSYETFEADLFSWLEQSYPEVAQSIGEPANLGYSSGKPEAVAAALPYVDEFVAQSETWPRVTGHRDLAGMSVLEAVLAEHEAFNSHDPEAFEAWYGRPPDDFVAWWWGLDTRFESDCDTTDNPAIVQCTSRLVDGFYGKACAVFEQTQLWTASGNELILLHTDGSVSDWAFWKLGQDMKPWMKEAYPEVVNQVFAGSGIIHNEEAAVIAMDYIDEFIEQSAEYPRAEVADGAYELINVVLYAE
jgi:hypothetical protein